MRSVQVAVLRAKRYGIRPTLRTKIWEIPKFRGTILRVPIIRTIVFGGLYWGPPILGNYHIRTRRMTRI